MKCIWNCCRQNISYFVQALTKVCVVVAREVGFTQNIFTVNFKELLDFTSLWLTGHFTYTDTHHFIQYSYSNIYLPQSWSSKRLFLTHLKAVQHKTLKISINKPIYCSLWRSYRCHIWCHIMDVIKTKDWINDGETLHVAYPILLILCLLMPWRLKEPGH